jgi:hypothetical protein
MGCACSVILEGIGNRYCRSTEKNLELSKLNRPCILKAIPKKPLAAVFNIFPFVYTIRCARAVIIKVPLTNLFISGHFWPLKVIRRLKMAKGCLSAVCRSERKTELLKPMGSPPAIRLMNCSR